MVRCLKVCERSFGIDRDPEGDCDPDPLLDGLQAVPTVRVPGDEAPLVRSPRSEAQVLAAVLDHERPASVCPREDERQAPHHPGCLFGVGVHREVPALAVDEELEGLERELRLTKAHLPGDRPEHPRPEPFPGGSCELHLLGAHLERIADRRVQQRLLATSVGRGLGESDQPRNILRVRRASEAPAFDLEHGTVAALAVCPGRGAELGFQQLDEPRPVAPVGHVRRVRAPLAGTKVVACGGVHRRISGCSLVVVICRPRLSPPTPGPRWRSRRCCDGPARDVRRSLPRRMANCILSTRPTLLASGRTDGNHAAHERLLNARGSIPL